MSSTINLPSTTVSVRPIPPIGPRTANPVASDEISRPLETKVIRASERRVWPLLLVVLLIGIAARAWIVLIPGIGHLSDMGFFLSWTRSLNEHGLGGFFKATSFCDYPPIWLLIMYGVGRLATLCHIALSNDYAMHALLKAPACLADLLITLLLFFEARRWLGGARALGAAALYFLNPLALYNSAYWGQVDAIPTAFCLFSLVLVNRNRFGLAGAAAALAMLAKFQSIAFMPLVVFEIFRRRRITGVFFSLVGALAMAALVALPFAIRGTMSEVFRRSYVDVIGQYNDLSRSAYNVWWFSRNPGASDTAVPERLVTLAAEGRSSFSDNASWLLQLSWRRISLIAYSLVVAVILSLYALRPNVVSRFGAAGLLGFAFFLFPTEMHERYAVPAIAFFSFWAVTTAWRERLFFLLCMFLLLNVAEFLSPRSISMPIAAANLLVFGLILGGLAFVTRPPMADATPAIPNEPAYLRSRLINLFQFMTILSVLCVLGLAGWIAKQAIAAPQLASEENSIYLGTLKPKLAQQGWKELRVDRSVDGSLIHLGSTIYLRGLGTHTRSVLTYAIPPDTERFEAVVGIDSITEGKGSALVSVELDGKPAEDFTPVTLTGASDPKDVSVALRGAKLLTLRAEPADNGNKADHVDWAMARFVRTP